ncbi:MAG: PTS ascorbate transporter subunit IIB, partial [Humibacter sp.]
MKIVAICGAGVGTSAILKVNAERALERLGLTADV